MKGEKANCANPDCNKEFIKKRYDQNCCGRSTCRVIYNRLKKGLGKYPDFMQGYTPPSSNQIAKTRFRGITIKQPNSGLGVSAANAVLTTAGATLARSVAGGSFLGNAAGAVVTSTLIPYVKQLIGNRGFSFISIDNELDLWRHKLAYWESRKKEAVNGIMPMNSFAGAALGGLVGSWVGQDKDKARNAMIGAALAGLLGAYLDNQKNTQVSINQQEILNEAENNIQICHQNINRLTGDREFYQSVIEENILVPNGDGVYVVNDELLEGVTTADAYQKDDIPTMQFKGSWNYLLGNTGNDFYKIVTGMPGNGKSTYAVKFASYYAANHGRVLYFPAEQFGKNKDFQNLLKRVGADNFDVQRKANVCSVEDIIGLVGKGQYKLIVLDSVNYMKLGHDDIQKIRERLPNVAIVAVMQSTKEGNFKGGQEYKHDCNLFVYVESFVAYQQKARSAGQAQMSLDELISVF